MIRKRTDYLVVHCSATPPNLDIGAAEIRGWHKAKGWADIGYHYVIRRNGIVEAGRPENLVGSHVQGHNSNSLGICMVGGTDARQKPENNYTPEQWASLQTLLTRLFGKYTGAKILGHRDFPAVAKACPCFDAIDWAKDHGLPAASRMRPVAASMLLGADAAPEFEDGDEADSDEAATEEGTPRASVGQWLTAWGSANGGGIGLGLMSGMPWQGIAVLCAFLTILIVGGLIWMGRENQQKLWKKILG